MARTLVEPEGGPSPVVLDSFRRAVVASDGVMKGLWDENNRTTDYDHCAHCHDYTMHEFIRDPVEYIEHVVLGSGRTIRVRVTDITYRCLVCNGRGKR
jgi:hypothetical protein